MRLFPYTIQQTFCNACQSRFLCFKTSLGRFVPQRGRYENKYIRPKPVSRWKNDNGNDHTPPTMVIVRNNDGVTTAVEIIIITGNRRDGN